MLLLFDNPFQCLTVYSQEVINSNKLAYDVTRENKMIKK
jgi:hypothetical protein